MHPKLWKNCMRSFVIWAHKLRVSPLAAFSQMDGNLPSRRTLVVKRFINHCEHA